MAEEGFDEFGNPNPKPDRGKEKKRKRKDKTRNETVEEEKEAQLSSKATELDSIAKERDALSPENAVREEADERDEERKSKLKKKRLLKEAAAADRRGVCYMSRVPPGIDPCRLRQLLSQYGDIQRIYLKPENPSAQVRRKPGGRHCQDVRFSEGWIEFSDKKIAKRVASMLNCQQIGGKRSSSVYYDLWNIKYLTKFKWDDLTEEISYKHAVREQKFSLEISAAKKEREFYLSKVHKARALSAIEERLKKKQKLQEDSGTGVDIPVNKKRVIRKFPQNRPVAVSEKENKPKLSKALLADVFGGGS